MHIPKVLAAVASLVACADAWNAPAYTGFSKKWQAPWTGAANSQPIASAWNYRLGDGNDNNEVQRWTKSTNNIRMTGAGSLQITPRKNSAVPGGWTSARIESKKVFASTKGKITRYEASIRQGGNSASTKQGIWPAFWLNGDAFRKGVPWPACGEMDVFETINGLAKSHAVVHCDKHPGGICNEPVGLVGTTPLVDSKYHTWRVEIDRRPSYWLDQKITWSVDGKAFFTVTAKQVNNFKVWSSLAYDPMYFILNVSVGGNWPGPPNAKTLGGTGAGMEVGYVAHYVSN
jgi:beta-glucanase (GH16 family)